MFTVFKRFKSSKDNSTGQPNHLFLEVLTDKKVKKKSHFVRNGILNL